jgi:hypothetical protein
MHIRKLIQDLEVLANLHGDLPVFFKDSKDGKLISMIGVYLSIFPDDADKKIKIARPGDRIVHIEGGHGDVVGNG